MVSPRSARGLCPARFAPLSVKGAVDGWCRPVAPGTSRGGGSIECIKTRCMYSNYTGRLGKSRSMGRDRDLNHEVVIQIVISY